MCNGWSRRAILASAAGLFASASLRGARADEAALRVGYIRSLDRHPTISLLDQQASDDGLAGAQLAMDDNNTTGQFMHQQFELVDVKVRDNADMPASLAKLTDQGIRLVLSDVDAPRLLKLADAGKAAGVVLFNLAAPDDSLRGTDCRDDTIHVAPSRSMLADAVAQYLVWKKWNKWFLMFGSHPNDHLMADAYRRAAKRFGAKIVTEREDKDTGGSRQTDTGLVEMQQMIPVKTQGAGDYDVLIAADENEVFAGYLPYRTWDARPVAGSAGLRPVTWDASSESWGGAQLQNRFERRFRRHLSPLDMMAWTAARMVGESASRSGSLDAAKVVAYLKGPDFGIGAYKGQRLTLRPWDWQLRQPIFLADGRTVVSISPQPGFLHQVTELDTLGMDRPETACKFVK